MECGRGACGAAALACAFSAKLKAAAPQAPLPHSKALATRERDPTISAPNPDPKFFRSSQPTEQALRSRPRKRGSPSGHVSRETSQRGSCVICETGELQLAVIPAKAGIQSVNRVSPQPCRVGSRLRGNDWRIDRDPIPNDSEASRAFCLPNSPAFDRFALTFCGWEPLGRVIAIANQKGGVGKTTTAINLGAALASRDMWTLIIDCDPQANTTGGLGFPKDPSRRTIYDALMLDVPLKELVLKTELEGLHLIPSNKNLVGATVELVDRPEREKALRNKMEKFRDDFNYILLDCPPALDLLTLNALVAADSVIVPVQCEYFALEGVSELLDTLIRVRRSHNHNLAVEGILLTMFDERTNLSHQVRDDLRDFFGDQVFSTVIPRNVRLAEAPSFGKPILLYDPDCRGASSYLELAQEVINHDQKGVGSRAERPASDR